MRKAMLQLGRSISRGSHVSCGKATMQVVLDEDLTDYERRVFTQPLALAMLGRYIIKLKRVCSLGTLR